MHIKDKTIFKAACDTIRMLHSKGIKCTPYTFQPVLRHYSIRGDKRRFYKVWDAMISNKYNVKPNRHLYSIKDKLDQHQVHQKLKFHVEFFNVMVIVENVIVFVNIKS